MKVRLLQIANSTVGYETSKKMANKNLPIKIGILHSLTGTMAISENAVVDATMLAIQEINADGGIGGRLIEPHLEDGASDWPTFAMKAQKLIDIDKVEVVFGCWTSASRKAVLPVFEQKNHLLFYPVQYEGQECSKNIFYTGATPNQQIEPAVKWLNQQYPNQNYFLIGSDYVFPRTANAIIEAIVVSFGLRSQAQYIPLGSSDISTVFPNIKAFMPNGGIIFNTLNGDTNVAFFQQYNNQLDLNKYPCMSVSITEEEVNAIGVNYLIGQFAAWNYFMSINSALNQKFIANFQAKYGKNRLLTDPMEAAYIGVHIWKQAVLDAGTSATTTVRKYAMNQPYPAPEGQDVKSGVNHHLYKYVRLGKVNANGQFDLVYDQGTAIEAQPWNKYIPSTANLVCDWSSDLPK